MDGFDIKVKELELKERELDLKEKELQIQLVTTFMNKTRFIGMTDDDYKECKDFLRDLWTLFPVG